VLAECARIDDVSDIRNALPARPFRLSLSLQFSVIRRNTEVDLRRFGLSRILRAACRQLGSTSTNQGARLSHCASDDSNHRFRNAWLASVGIRNQGEDGSICTLFYRQMRPGTFSGVWRGFPSRRSPRTTTLSKIRCNSEYAILRPIARRCLYGTSSDCWLSAGHQAVFAQYTSKHSISKIRPPGEPQARRRIIPLITTYGIHTFHLVPEPVRIH
jgi:hypothetical protein